MSSASNKAAFTLIELLVVISIILIATSILFVGGGSGSDGVKLSSAQRIVSSIAQGVRGQALLKNTEARLIIYSENNTDGDPDKLLRYFGIVYWGKDSDGNEGWMAATQGTYLPEGIYFNDELSKARGGGNIPTMNLDYPRLKAGANGDRTNGGGSEQYYFYEFSSNGTMAQSSAETKSTGFSNSWLALQAGTLKPIDGKLSITFDEEDKTNVKAALIFRRVGSTTLVTNPAEITEN